MDIENKNVNESSDNLESPDMQEIPQITEGKSSVIKSLLSKISLPKWSIITIASVAGVAVVATAAILVISGNKPSQPTPTPPAHVHAFGDWTVSKEASCTEEGVSIRSCECGESESKNISALGHNEVIVPAVEADCTKSGLSEGRICDRCNATILAQSEIPKTNHTYSDENDESCNGCGFIRQVNCAHENQETLKGVKPGCTTVGYTEGKKCIDCDEIIVEQKVISALGHTNVKDKAVEATCTETGLTEGKHCSVCGTVTLAQTVISKKDHTEVIDPALDASCTETGLTEGKHCSVCNTVILAQTVTDKKDHNYVNDVCTYCSQRDPDAVQYSEGFTFKSNNDGTCYINDMGSCTDTDLVIPPTSPAGDKVTKIGYYAFANNTNLKSVVIPDSVTSIKAQAFYNCTALTSLEFGDSLTTIGEFAFGKCQSLASIKFGNGLTTIGYYAFSGCKSLTSLILPDSVTTIDRYAFSQCKNLTSVKFGDSLTAIGNYAFNLCAALTSIEFGDSQTTIGNYAFYSCEGLRSLKIPGNVTAIGDSAFKNCKGLTSVEFENGITSIGNSAFYDCSGLTSIIIPASVAYIGDSPFASCDKLTEISVDLNSNYYNAIDGNLYTKDGKALVEYAPGKKATSFTVPNEVTTIENSAFAGCHYIDFITIPAGVTAIGKDAFYLCTDLRSITVDSNNQHYKSIDGNLYTKDAKALIHYAQNKNDVEFIIPDGVTTICENAFSNNSSLTLVTIPKSVTEISKKAFHFCSSLKNISYDGTVDEWKNISLSDDWLNFSSSVTYIQCSDGQVQI